MSYREVPMLELVKGVLRLWCDGAAKKRVTTQLDLDIKTAARRGPSRASLATIKRTPLATPDKSA